MAVSKSHVLVIPFPVQSHINPMLQFSKSLSSNDLNVTFILTTKISKSIQIPLNSSINFVSISDGSEEIQEQDDSSKEAYFKRFNANLSKNLTNYIEQEKGSSSLNSTKLIVYDSVMPWILDIARQENLLGASFFTQSCSVSAITYHLKHGLLDFSSQDVAVSFPFMPVFGIKDLPSFQEVMDPNQTILRLLIDQFSNLEKADWVLFNTYHRLENEVVDWMSSQWAIRTIGPTNLLLQKEDDKKKDIIINLFETNYQGSEKWLDSKETGSVIYVSFGSLISLKEEQIEELAQGLLLTKHNFLWVVRDSEVHKLPQDITSLVSSDKGLIVNWCHQTEVLNHCAVACLLTHGGWNSTIEALSYGVPLIAMPHWVDQTTNSKFIEDIWKVGIRAKGNENGIVLREEIAMCIKDVMEGDKGKEIKINACKWKKMAREAVDKGGSSAKNIEDIVSKVLL